MADGMMFQGERRGLWDEREIYHLKGLILLGETASAIARLLGRNKNSVCGQAHRLGLSIGAGPHSKALGRRSVKSPRKVRRVSLIERVRHGSAGDSRSTIKHYDQKAMGEPVPFNQRSSRQCAWICIPGAESAQADSPSCGAKCLPDSSYCARHHCRATKPAKPEK